MKILAKSRTIAADESEFTPEVLRAEARYVWELQQAGVVREIHFTHEGEAVLLLECLDRTEAQAVLSRMPLVRAGLIDFTVDELRAYDGYARLFAEK